MELGLKISVYFDKKRVKHSGKYPIKIRIYSKRLKKAKLFSTDLDLTQEDYSEAWETTKTKAKYKKLRMQITSLEMRAYDIAKDLPIFKFDEFEKKFNGYDRIGIVTVNDYYSMAINDKEKINTKEQYLSALKSFLKYNNQSILTFDDITVKWLNGYEKWHVLNMSETTKGNPLSTVGRYLRTLRAVIRSAIADGKIGQAIYPFGEKMYVIPNPKGSKQQALTLKQLNILKDSIPDLPQQLKAKAFWFFSFYSNGMNFADIVQLRYKDIDGETVTFIREKVKNTNKSQRPITFFLNSMTEEVINVYGNIKKTPNTLVFNIINPKSSELQQLKDRKQFIKTTNHHFKRFANYNGVDVDVTTYWARHTFATLSITKAGVSIAQLSEALGHSSIKTTEGYIAGFDNEEKKRHADTMYNLKEELS